MKFFSKIQYEFHDRKGGSHTDRVSSISLKYSSVQFAIPFTPIMAEGGEGG